MRDVPYACLWIEKRVGIWPLRWWQNCTGCYTVLTMRGQEEKEEAALRAAGIGREAVDGVHYRWNITVVTPEMLEEDPAFCA